MTDIRAAARALGGNVIGRSKILCPGPGHSRRDRSLSVVLDPLMPDGFAVNSFAGDDWRECKDHVRALLGIPHDMRPVTGKIPSEPTERTYTAESGSRRDYAISLWLEAGPIGGTPAERYLRHRGIEPDFTIFDGAALRFHARCPFRLDNGETVRFSAMLGLMRNIETNDATGIHRTALRPDGAGKAEVQGLGNPKKMLGTARNAAVKLSADDDVTLGLHIAEGVETALAVMAMGFRPMWACLSAGGIARLPVLSGIEALTIFADRDNSGTGQRAARECAERWHKAKREVRIIAPPIVGDFADEVAA